MQPGRGCRAFCYAHAMRCPSLSQRMFYIRCAVQDMEHTIQRLDKDLTRSSMSHMADLMRAMCDINGIIDYLCWGDALHTTGRVCYCCDGCSRVYHDAVCGAERGGACCQRGVHIHPGLGSLPPGEPRAYGFNVQSLGLRWGLGL